jgi:hypothetical protein
VIFAGRSFSDVTHEICQRVQFRAHQAALASPSCDHAVKEIEKQAKRHESQSCPKVASLVGGAKAVAHGELNGHDAAETVHEGDEVGKVVGADQAEVAWVLGLEEVGLLVLSWSLLARDVSYSLAQTCTHKAAAQLLWQSSRRHWALQIFWTCWW